MFPIACAHTSVQTWPPPAGERTSERHTGAGGVRGGGRHDGSVDIGRRAAGVSAGRLAVGGGRGPAIDRQGTPPFNTPL